MKRRQTEKQILRSLEVISALGIDSGRIMDCSDCICAEPLQSLIGGMEATGHEGEAARQAVEFPVRMTKGTVR